MSLTNVALISINLLFGYFVYRKINQNGRHLTLNRWFLISFPLVAIALGMLYHYSDGSVLHSFSIDLPIVEISSSVQSTHTSPTINWVNGVYVFGVLFSVIHFAWSLWEIRRPSNAKLLNRLGKQQVYLVSNKTYSYSHFNAIYISEFQLDNAEFILEHELAHSRQKHSLDILLIRAIRCLLWFHPIVYLWESSMKENHEYLADNECVKNSDNVQAYSYALLSSHLGVSIPELANGFNQKSLLQKRIIQLKTHNTFNMKKVILIPAVLVGVILTMSVQLTSNEAIEATSNQGKSEIFKDEVDTKPEFVGGMEAMIAYFQKNINYPKDLANKNIKAKVHVKFEVSKTGKIKKVKVVRGSEHEAFNKEATRVVSNMPDWTPGKKDGKTVCAEMTLPIQFVLSK